MPEWWPAVVFGWPSPILATILCLVGLVRKKGGFLVAAAIVVAPFAFFLLGTPRFRYGGLLPVLPLIAATALQRGARVIAWVAVIAMVAFVSGVAVFLAVWRAQHPTP